MSQRSLIDDNLASSAYSKSRQNFAAHLVTLVFTPRERLECICNNQLGKKALDTSNGYSKHTIPDFSNLGDEK